MDQVKTGRLIRTMRAKLGLTQLALAEQLGVSDKAVSNGSAAAVLPISRSSHCYHRPSAWTPKPC